jgi:hypothetical protein
MWHFERIENKKFQWRREWKGNVLVWQSVGMFVEITNGHDSINVLKRCQNMINDVSIANSRFLFPTSTT